ncbi:MAG: biotin synthase BioB [Lentisphaeria bacterium]|nr:biotin synthase BioB [Lentisphaeria bacterium]
MNKQVQNIFSAAQKFDQLADAIIGGATLTREQGLEILATPDHEILALLNGAYKIRFHYFSNKVKLNMLMNAKSGYCPEDCGYCSQSKVSDAPIEKYTLLDKETMVAGAREAQKRKAGTYCIVCSGRGPTPKTVDQVCDAVKEIKGEMPNMKICACLGLLREGQAEELKEAGVDRYNHNINTSSEHHKEICSTHTYDDRVNTIEKVKNADISPCSGVIVGMGESDADRVDTALALKDLDSDSIPVNFLNAICGTPLEGTKGLGPYDCLRALALFRFACPSKELRASAGRELHLGSLQPMALFAANSLFVGDYLTTEGQAWKDDHKIIEDLGFEFDMNEDS